jgi:hypothetical protein
MSENRTICFEARAHTMETNPICQSPLICDRIAAIHIDLESYRENIKLLLDVIENNKHIKMTPYAPRVIKYSCIPISERRFHWTLQHLRSQVKLLETELGTLIKFMVNEGAA